MKIMFKLSLCLAFTAATSVCEEHGTNQQEVVTAKPLHEDPLISFYHAATTQKIFHKLLRSGIQDCQSLEDKIAAEQVNEVTINYNNLSEHYPNDLHTKCWKSGEATSHFVMAYPDKAFLIGRAPSYACTSTMTVKAYQDLMTKVRAELALESNTAIADANKG